MIIYQLFLLLLGINLINGYKVLIYSGKFAFSHMNFMGSIADTLQKAGHEVTVLQPLLTPEIRGTGVSSDAKVVEVEFDEEGKKMVAARNRNDVFKILWEKDTKNPIGVIFVAPQAAIGFDLSMKNVLKRKDIMDQLRAEKFDIAIAEMFDYGGFPIFYELGIKNLVGAHSTVLTDRTSYAIGSPILPSFVPPMQSGEGDDGSFYSRLSNTLFTVSGWYFETTLEGPAQRYLTEHHPDAPSIQEMIANMSFIFTNAEPLLDFPRPTLHKVVDLGGIGLKTPKKLDETWLKILSQRKRNVLISFGSVAPSSHMPDTYKHSISEVARRFPDVTFIWKYETPEDNLNKGVENLHLSKWTPQTDLLGSGKIDLFVTHGGAGSIMETASSGVPVVAIPIFGDQFRNALMAKRFGFAHVIDKFQLGKAEDLVEAVRFGLEDMKLMASAKKAKELLASRPFSPQEKLIRHMDLAVKFGNIQSMSPSGRNFSIIQYHNYDVFAFLAVVIGAFSVFVIFVVKFCIGKCFKSQKKEKAQ